MVSGVRLVVQCASTRACRACPAGGRGLAEGRGGGARAVPHLPRGGGLDARPPRGGHSLGGVGAHAGRNEIAGQPGDGQFGARPSQPVGALLGPSCLSPVAGAPPGPHEPQHCWPRTSLPSLSLDRLLPSLGDWAGARTSVLPEPPLPPLTACTPGGARCSCCGTFTCVVASRTPPTPPCPWAPCQPFFAVGARGDHRALREAPQPRDAEGPGGRTGQEFPLQSWLSWCLLSQGPSRRTRSQLVSSRYTRLPWSLVATVSFRAKISFGHWWFRLVSRRPHRLPWQCRVSLSLGTAWSSMFGQSCWFGMPCHAGC
jgi:hypothetical protein